MANPSHPHPFAPAISFWCSLWQSQLEQSLKFWSAWAQLMPHDSARKLAAEAQALAEAASPGRPRAQAAAAARVTRTVAGDAARPPRTLPARPHKQAPAKPPLH